MPIKTIACFALIAAASLPTSAAAQVNDLSFSLTYLGRVKIKDVEAGLTEPSGLALAPEGDALWTVSDEEKRIFKLSLEGGLLKDRSFKIDDKGLEGVAVDPASGNLLVVGEETSEILRIDPALEETVSRHLLSKMTGFGAIERHFSSGDDNEGLEGITFNQDTDTFFVLKESAPGLIIEVSKDLRSVLSVRVLNAGNGFLDDDIQASDVDFSGVQYDPTRSSFWIVSDRAKRLFLYDLDRDQVVQSAALGYAKDGEFREIEKVEGVTVNPDSRRLYVVSDNEARLYVFDLR
jgi:uncharacterized protein YjiK